MQNSDGDVLTKLTAYPLEALKTLATHFEARLKDLLHTCADDILRAWKIGRLDHLVGNNVSPRTSLGANNSKSGNDIVTDFINDGSTIPIPGQISNGLQLHGLEQRPGPLSTMNDNFPKLPSTASSSASDSKGTTRATSPDAFQNTRTTAAAIVNTANVANAPTLPTEPSTANVDEEIFMSDEEEEEAVVGDVISNITPPSSLLDPIKSSHSDVRLPTNAVGSASSTVPPVAAVPIAASIHSADETVESVSSLQRLLTVKQLEHQSLLDEMMVPSDQSGTPLEQIMSKMTKLNMEMEEIKSRLKTFKPEAGITDPCNPWGGLGTIGNGLGLGGGGQLPPGSLSPGMNMVPGLTTAPAPPNYNPLSAPFIPPYFGPTPSGPPGPLPSGPFGPAPSSSLFPSSNSSLFPASSSSNGFVTNSGISSSAAVGSSLFPSSNLLSDVDNIFSPFGASEAPFGPLHRQDSNKEDDLSSLLRSPMLNPPAPTTFLPANGGICEPGRVVTDGKLCGVFF